MFIFKVYHATNPMFGIGETPEFPKAYKLAAEVTIPDDNLDHVFELTNHITHDWTTNMGVIAEPGDQRSTSVGDVAVNETTGKRYLCEMAGWKEI